MMKPSISFPKGSNIFFLRNLLVLLNKNELKPMLLSGNKYAYTYTNQDAKLSVDCYVEFSKEEPANAFNSILSVKKPGFNLTESILYGKPIEAEPPRILYNIMVGEYRMNFKNIVSLEGDTQYSVDEPVKHFIKNIPVDLQDTYNRLVLPLYNKLNSRCDLTEDPSLTLDRLSEKNYPTEE